MYIAFGEGYERSRLCMMSRNINDDLYGSQKGPTSNIFYETLNINILKHESIFWNTSKYIATQ